MELLAHLGRVGHRLGDVGAEVVGMRARVPDPADSLHRSDPAQQIGEPPRAHPSALPIVCRNKARMSIGLQTRINDDYGNIPFGRSFDRRHEGAIVQRSKYDGVDPATDKVLYNLDLHLTIVLTLRTLPYDVHSKFTRRLVRSGVNTLPERMCRAFRNYRYLQPIWRRIALATAHNHDRDQKSGDDRTALDSAVLSCAVSRDPKNWSLEYGNRKLCLCHFRVVH